MVIKSLKIFTGICTFIVLAWVFATTSLPVAPAAQPCTQEWFSYLDKHYFDISDREGHGPDLGSGEWLGAAEARAKMPVKNLLPEEQRCQLIQGQLKHHIYIINRELGLVISL